MALFRTFPSSPMLPVLYRGGLYLRMPQLGDFDQWAELRAASRSFLQPWEPLWPADDLTRPSFRRRLRRYGDEIREDSAYPFFLFRQSDDVLLGGLTFSNVRRGVVQATTLGYWMGSPHAGKGLMTEGVRACLPFVFGHLGLHRLEAACLPSNASSIRLLEKVGFKREGIARRYLCINGRWQDHILYGLLADDPQG
ncbi:ribosomal-protein-alanine N-acetyltransferase [Agaricicola taiwanensis]|uniref:Ribosomal-protein-alanine N-acetyltransferase n=1 Tax=Agaricicola taiwanensis TaxID=591372 RepID=A0A8J2VKS6_9RHOB|nr:GNAT family protein [Agaricicola taiwanensis]GGE34696.1 ribosomal-protein-alanine N-acetyltransferase [Agaricicola taiwanensis]